MLPTSTQTNKPRKLEIREEAAVSTENTQGTIIYGHWADGNQIPTGLSTSDKTTCSKYHKGLTKLSHCLIDNESALTSKRENVTVYTQAQRAQHTTCLNLYL